MGARRCEWYLSGMLRTLPLVVASVSLLSCAHHGTLSTPRSSVIVLGQSGLPQFPQTAQRCPNGLGDGAVQLTWQSTGEKRFKGRCEEGLMVGEWKAYFENGALEWKATFVRGFLAGDFHSWHANDAKHVKAKFVDGLAEGLFESWHITGEKAARGTLNRGEKNGCWETWHDNGKHESKGTWSEGKQVKTWLYWTRDGERRKEKLGGEALHGECLLTL